MIEPEDLIIPENFSNRNRLAIDTPDAFDQAKAEIIAARLSELQTKPVVGAYDATHLQQIHARIFEGVFPCAGKLRESQSSAPTSSLDVLFDRLARKNRLKGVDTDVWSKRSAEYIAEIVSIEPFIEGTELASMEFFRELAGENNINLRWTNAIDEPSHELQPQVAKVQSNNLRRLLMLAVDPDQARVRDSRDLKRRNTLELIVSPDRLL